jgi:hypothetical protein
MKLGVAVFRDCVSPRVDISDSLLVYDIHEGTVDKKETHSLTYDQPDQLISILQEKDVSALVCGGCPRFFLRMFRFHNVEVIAGMTGNPEHVVKTLVEGKRPFPAADDFRGGRWRSRGKIKQKNKFKIKEV